VERQRLVAEHLLEGNQLADERPHRSRSAHRRSSRNHQLWADSQDRCRSFSSVRGVSVPAVHRQRRARRLSTIHLQPVPDRRSVRQPLGATDMWMTRPLKLATPLMVVTVLTGRRNILGERLSGSVQPASSRQPAS